MIALEHAAQSQHRWHVFEDTKAWLDHVAAVEASIDRRHGRSFAERAWSGEA